MELHYVYFSIVLYPCAVSNTINYSVLPYPDYRPWLPGTPFSALFPCFGAGVMGGRHIWYQSEVNRFQPTLADVTTYERRNCNFDG